MRLPIYTGMVLVHEINWDNWMKIKAMRKARRGAGRKGAPGAEGHGVSADDSPGKVGAFASMLNRR